jgi:hypothetical protein
VVRYGSGRASGAAGGCGKGQIIPSDDGGDKGSPATGRVGSPLRYGKALPSFRRFTTSDLSILARRGVEIHRGARLERGDRDSGGRGWADEKFVLTPRLFHPGTVARARPVAGVCDPGPASQRPATAPIRPGSQGPAPGATPGGPHPPASRATSPGGGGVTRAARRNRNGIGRGGAGIGSSPTFHQPSLALPTVLPAFSSALRSRPSPARSPTRRSWPGSARQGRRSQGRRPPGRDRQRARNPFSPKKTGCEMVRKARHGLSRGRVQNVNKPP